MVLTLIKKHISTLFLCNCLFKTNLINNKSRLCFNDKDIGLEFEIFKKIPIIRLNSRLTL